MARRKDDERSLKTALRKVSLGTNDAGEELKSLSLFFRNAYTMDFYVEGKELVGFGLILERISKRLRKFGLELDEIETMYPDVPDKEGSRDERG